ncbi:MAG: YqgE/AlgH family protein [Sneathiella sp.]|nr:YqgE/AlgH family protein [Sneathiella sp.]
MGDIEQKNSYFEGQILIAMPTMSDPRFQKSVILLCAHTSDGAMGIVLNKNIDIISFRELLGQLDLTPNSKGQKTSIHFGGPVETERGFVLHSTDLMHDSTMMIGDGIALTATVDMLKTMAVGEGPNSSFLALGYSGWGPGQLEDEIQDNGWLIVDADPDLVFGEKLDLKWTKAIQKLGIDPNFLSSEVGHA